MFGLSTETERDVGNPELGTPVCISLSTLPSRSTVGESGRCRSSPLDPDPGLVIRDSQQIDGEYCKTFGLLISRTTVKKSLS